VPAVGSYGPGAPNWQTAYPTVVHALWLYHGDTRIVQRHWPSLLRYMSFVDGEHAARGLKGCCSGFGDWVPPPSAPGKNDAKKANGNLVGAFAYLRDVTLMRDLAAVAGSDAAHGPAAYEKQFNALAAEFNGVWYDNKTKAYASGGATAMQTETALPLWLGIVPPADVGGVLDAYVHDIAVTHGGHTSAGIVGIKFGLEALTMYNRTDVGVAMALVDTYPSYGYMVQGAGNPEPATTIWELWDAPFEGPGMDSRNHIMFGTIGSWLFKAVAGVSPQTCGLGGARRCSAPLRRALGLADEEGSAGGAVPFPVGYDAVSVYPAAVGVSPNLTSVSATVPTPHGDVSVAWATDAATGALTLNVGVPVGTVAEVAVPFFAATAATVAVTEGGAPVWSDGKFVGAGVAGMHSGTAGPNAIVFVVGSGEYAFQAVAKSSMA
jgi:hypothetical protein